MLDFLFFQEYNPSNLLANNKRRRGNAFLHREKGNLCGYFYDVYRFWPRPTCLWIVRDPKRGTRSCIQRQLSVEKCSAHVRWMVFHQLWGSRNGLWRTIVVLSVLALQK